MITFDSFMMGVTAVFCYILALNFLSKRKSETLVLATKYFFIIYVIFGATYLTYCVFRFLFGLLF